MDRHGSSRLYFICALLGLALFAAPTLAGNDFWTVIGQPAGGSVQRIIVNPKSPSTVYALGQSGVFVSTNSGASWTGKFVLGPDTYGADMAVDPLNGTTLYVAGEQNGIFASSDGGNTWATANTGLAGIGDISSAANFIENVTADPVTEGTVYATAFSGGVYKSTDTARSWASMNTGLP